jgi:Subtilisin-like serine proteases
MFTTLRSQRVRNVALSALLGSSLCAGPLASVASAATPAPNSVTADPGFHDLEQRAARDGRVPVIVEFDTRGIHEKKGEQQRDLVKRRDGVLQRFRHKKLRGLKALAGAPFMSVHADRDDLAVLASTPGVSRVVLDDVHDIAGTSSKGDAAGSQNTPWWDYYRVGADWANNNGYNGSGQQVVVIDTGVDKTHPWLQGKVVNEACFATNANGTGACNNGATYQYSNAAAGVPGSASPCTYNRGTCSHGTHVAHTAAGKYGVARGATIVAIKAAHAEWDAATSQYVPRFNDSDLANALWYVYNPLPTIPAAINMSIGGGRYYNYCDSASTTISNLAGWINALKRDYGIATVVSSGNDNFSDSMGSPACIANAVSVGNTTLDTAGNDAVFGYTKYGSDSNSTLDLLAPGTDICSAIPAGNDVFDGTNDGMACDWIGTSMAAPHVAGAFAIMRQSRRTASVDTIVSALARRGTAVTDSRNGITRSRINVAMAVYYW